MPDALDIIRAELRDPVEELRPLFAEYERLQAALVALDGIGAGKARPAPGRSVRGAENARSAPTTQRKPARRGENREQVMTALAVRAGATAGELASASGVQSKVVYGLLRRLVDEGVVEKQELPGGKTGYAVSGDGATDGSGAEAAPLTADSVDGSSPRAGGVASSQPLTDDRSVRIRARADKGREAIRSSEKEVRLSALLACLS